MIILIDDLGWNDVPWNNGSDFDLPNINKMALQSLILNNYYTQHICTPTRAALLSGRYPANLGLQHGLIKPDATYGLPLNTNIISQDLKKLGYITHAIGKWHVKLNLHIIVYIKISFNHESN